MFVNVTSIACAVVELPAAHVSDVPGVGGSDLGFGFVSEGNAPEICPEERVQAEQQGGHHDC